VSGDKDDKKRKYVFDRKVACNGDKKEKIRRQRQTGLHEASDMPTVMVEAWLSLLTFSVMRIERNLRLSPINMQLLTHGNSFFTLSSIDTGGIFSPPAVIINSANNNTS